MKIKEVNTYVVSQKLGEERFSYSQAWYNSRTIMLLEIVTDDGITGWGESFGNAFVNKTIIDSVYAQCILNEDVFATERIWESLYNKMRDNGQKGCSIEAISAIDIALWDLKGQYTHMPVYRLLGGCRRDYIVPYATGLYRGESADVVEELIKEAVGYAEQGFRAIKMKIGFGLEKDIISIRRVRQAIGKEIKLMVDANHAYNASSAIYLSRSIEEFDIGWFEEPVPPEDIEGYIELKNKTNIPVAGGETEFTRYGFNRMLAKRAVDIVQPDCCVTGGISEFVKIAALATIHNIQCFPHVWGSAVALRAGINCAFALPNYPDSLNPQEMYLELDRTPNIFREELSPMPYILDGQGHMPIEEFEGLGLHIDKKLIEKYRVL